MLTFLPFAVTILLYYTTFYAKSDTFMNKKSIICANYPLTVLCEDFYICNSTGDILSSREHSHRIIKNVFSRVSPDDLAYINSALNSYQAAPLVLVGSDIGPLFIDVSTLSVSGALLVIASNIDASSAVYIAERCLRGLVAVSDSILECVDAQVCEPSPDALLLADRLRTIYSHDEGGSFAAKSPATEVLAALDVILGISALCGCSALIRTEAYDDGRELQGSLCQMRLRSALSSLLLIGHKYSAQRRVEIEIGFSELGIRLDISLDIAQRFSDAPMRDYLELNVFLRRADRHFMDCQCHQEGNKFSVALFPWQQKILSTDLKREKKRF